MTIKVNFTIVVALLMLLGIGCSQKEDLTPAKRAASQLRQEWMMTNNSMRELMTAMQENLKKLNQGVFDLEKGLKSPKANYNQRRAMTKMLDNAIVLRDSLKIEVDNLNAFLKTWNVESKKMNQLLKLLQNEQITVAEAQQQITTLYDAMSKAQTNITEFSAIEVAYNDRTKRVTRSVKKNVPRTR